MSTKTETSQGVGTEDLLDERSCRRRFLQRLWGMSCLERTHLLSIEHDTEIRALFEACLAEQWFELAAEMKHEMKRRGREMPVSSSNTEGSRTREHE